MLSRATSRQRPDQAVPAMLEEEDERLKVQADQVDNALCRLRPIGPHVSLQKCGIYLAHVSRMYSPFAGLGEQIISRQCGPFIFSKKSQPICTFLKYTN